jgi:hypothetical protein
MSMNLLHQNTSFIHLMKLHYMKKKTETIVLLFSTLLYSSDVCHGLVAAIPYHLPHKYICNMPMYYFGVNYGQRGYIPTCIHKET